MKTFGVLGWSILVAMVPFAAMVSDVYPCTWGLWSQCSRSCGVGAKVQRCSCFRTSSVSKRVNACVGTAKKYELCNQQPCTSIPSTSYSLSNWVTSPRRPDLVPGPPLVLSQELDIGSFSIQNAIPLHHSLAVCEDCGGHGCCRRYFRHVDLSKGLHFIVAFAIGTADIRITKQGASNVHLVLQNRFGGTIFSGVSRPSTNHGEEHVVGNITVVYYLHIKETDETVISIFGSQKEALHLWVLARTDAASADIMYEFTKGNVLSRRERTSTVSPQLVELAPWGDDIGREALHVQFEYDDDEINETEPRFENVTHVSTNYVWKTIGPIYCSSSCTPGVTFMYAQCVRSTNGETVNESMCDISKKPKPNPEMCAGRECNARWVVGLWSSCSVTCGVGLQRRSIRCWRILAPGFDSTVHKQLCDDLTRPPQIRVCRGELCKPQWLMTDWNKCECGEETREVRCSAGDDQECRNGTRPLTSRPCSMMFCRNQWVVDDWSECANDCSIRKRNVTCRDNVSGNVVDAINCAGMSKPIPNELCSTLDGNCPPTWVPQVWTLCSSTCGSATKSRKVLCMGLRGSISRVYREKHCLHLLRPELTSPCPQLVDCQPRWFYSSWSKCSTTCDAGYRVRKVFCYHENSIDCSNIPRPAGQEWCNLSPCPSVEIHKTVE